MTPASTTSWRLQFGDPRRALKIHTGFHGRGAQGLPNAALALSGFGMELDGLKCRVAGFEGA